MSIEPKELHSRTRPLRSILWGSVFAALAGVTIFFALGTYFGTGPSIRGGLSGRRSTGRGAGAGNLQKTISIGTCQMKTIRFATALAIWPFLASADVTISDGWTSASVLPALGSRQPAMRRRAILRHAGERGHRRAHAQRSGREIHLIDTLDPRCTGLRAAECAKAL